MEKSICIHFIDYRGLFAKKYCSHVPSIGHEIRLGGKGDEKYYKVEGPIVWVYDEPENPCDRVNVGISEALGC